MDARAGTVTTTASTVARNASSVRANPTSNACRARNRGEAERDGRHEHEEPAVARGAHQPGPVGCCRRNRAHTAATGACSSARPVTLGPVVRSHHDPPASSR